MDKLVIDSSVALKWVLQEPDRERALELRQRYVYGACELIAPDVLQLEIGHVLSKLHRQHKLSSEDAEAYAAEILTTCPDFVASSVLFPAAFNLSIQSHASLYDCLYVALAEDQNCPLVTADRRLINNLGGGAGIIHLDQL